MDIITVIIINISIVGGIVLISMFLFYMKNVFLLDNNREYSCLFNIFKRYTGFQYQEGRFLPGSITNPLSATYQEPKVLFPLHDRKQKQAIIEGKSQGVKIIGINNITWRHFLYDKVIIQNNFNFRAIGYTLWIILKILQKKGRTSDIPDVMEYLVLSQQKISESEESLIKQILKQ